MNDFLRACNCEHPTEEDCDKCIGEASPKAQRPPETVPATPAASKDKGKTVVSKGRKKS